MIHYKDKSFCSISKDCANKMCFRYLSERESARAADLDLPICTIMITKESCSDYKPAKVEDAPNAS